MAHEAQEYFSQLRREYRDSYNKVARFAFSQARVDAFKWSPRSWINACPLADGKNILTTPVGTVTERSTRIPEGGEREREWSWTEKKKEKKKKNCESSRAAALWYSLSVAGCQRTKHNYASGWSTSWLHWRLPPRVSCPTGISLFASKLYSYLGDYVDDPSGSGALKGRSPC